jgi:penicillin-binding protein 1A
MPDILRRLLTRLGASLQLLIVTVVIAALLAAAGLRAIATVAPAATRVAAVVLGDAPPLDAAVRQGLSAPSKVLAADGSIIGRFRPEERYVPITADAIPEPVVAAVVAAEDAGFLHHAGIDVQAIARATIANLQHGGISQGGSTITQQLVKNLFTDGDRTIARKLEEARLALVIEREHGKREILAAYLNTVFFGEGAIGIRAAARTYFDKPVEQLNLSEAALLAGIIPAPTVYNPRVDPEGAEARRLEVLDRALESGLASLDEVRTARQQEPMVVAPKRAVEAYPYFLDYVRRWLLDVEGVPGHDLYHGGLTIETTLDRRIQDAARGAVSARLPDPAGPSASVVVIDPKSGAVRALVGGRDWEHQRVNLALGRAGGGSGQQPGSAFKPIVLALAYERGASSQDLVDAPAALPVGDDGHVVRNYGRRGYGKVTLAEATRRSINTAFVSLATSLGLDDVARLARELGLTAVPETGVGPSLAIGAYEVSPLAMTSAYGAFANDGVRASPRPVRRIFDVTGAPITLRTPTEKQVLTKDAARLVSHTLRGVVDSGTGRGARLEGREVAGKTGTTDDYRDAWFVGYTPDLVTSVWMGHAASNAPMRDVAGVSRVTGGSIPARLWRDVMTVALEGVEPAPFPTPPRRPRRQPTTTSTTTTLTPPTEVTQPEQTAARGRSTDRQRPSPTPTTTTSTTTSTTSPTTTTSTTSTTTPTPSSSTTTTAPPTAEPIDPMPEEDQEPDRGEQSTTTTVGASSEG